MQRELTLRDFGRRIEPMATPKNKPFRIPARIPQKAGSRHGLHLHFERLHAGMKSCNTICQPGLPQGKG